MLTILAPTLCGHTTCDFGICRCQHTLQALGTPANAFAQLFSRRAYARVLLRASLPPAPILARHGRHCTEHEQIKIIHICHLFNIKTNMYYVIPYYLNEIHIILVERFLPVFVCVVSLFVGRALPLIWFYCCMFSHWQHIHRDVCQIAMGTVNMHRVVLFDTFLAANGCVRSRLNCHLILKLQFHLDRSITCIRAFCIIQ